MRSTALKAALAASIALPAAAVGTGVAVAQGAGTQPAHASWQVTTVLSGASLSHHISGAPGSPTEPLTKPDDLTHLHGELLVAFQNGVGAQGEPSGSGNTASTVVAFSKEGKVLGQWDVIGKVDGMTADPRSGRVIATANEDGNSSLYVIDPAAGTAQHYTYDQSPLPHHGGTDAIAIYGDRILISASAPGTPSAANQNPPAAPQPQYPAVYSVSLNPETSVAAVSPLFSDEATATAANGNAKGTQVTLGLTDPDSSSVVPGSSPRFAHDYMLDSQGDQQEIYVADPGGPAQQLSVLALDQSVNDTAWATSEQGALYASDSSADAVVAITGSFTPGAAFVAATPCSANSAPSTCTTPNFLGTLDLGTGHVAPVALPTPVQPGGLIFVGPHRGSGEDGGHDGGAQGGSTAG